MEKRGASHRRERGFLITTIELSQISFMSCLGEGKSSALFAYDELLRCSEPELIAHG